MSTDPTFTVEWTVPADEWGDDAHDESDDQLACATAHPTPVDAQRTTPSETARTDRIDADEGTAGYATRDPANLPPASVLAAHVDALRADREQRERETKEIRDRYESIIDARNEEIRELRARQDDSRTVLGRLRDLF